MNLDGVIKLLDAGYTKQEIADMLNADQGAAQETQTEQKEEPKTEPKTDPKQEQKQEPVPEYVKQLSASIDALKKAVEVGNLAAGRQPEQPAKTVDDILAEAMKGDRF